MPRKEKPVRRQGTRYWRITSQTKINITLAVKAKKWGAPTKLGLRAIRPGDRIAFYVSKGHMAGYWGTATVTSELFVDRTPVWHEDTYPFRFSLKPDNDLREESIKSDEVMKHLRAGKLSSLRRTSIAPLTAEEFRIISSLIHS